MRRLLPQGAESDGGVFGISLLSDPSRVRTVVCAVQHGREHSAHERAGEPLSREQVFGGAYGQPGEGLPRTGGRVFQVVFQVAGFSRWRGRWFVKKRV